MKKFLFLLSLVILACNTTFGQGTNTTCATADGFCTGNVVSYPASYDGSGAGNGPQATSGADYDCLLSTPDPTFYIFQIGTGGNMTIHIDSQDGSGVGHDVDFICWGPYASVNCNNLNLVTDCSFSAATSENVQINGAVSGQYYVLMVTNYANVASNITFSQTGGSATTNCQIVCNFDVPATICQSAGPLTLSNYLSPTTVGTGNFTGTGVSGGQFNPAGLNGNITITYTVSSAVCTDVINVGGGNSAAWTPPANVCATASAVSLPPLITGTAGGTWSGTGVSGNNFNPSGLSGNQLVTYTVGPAGCTSTSSQNINVVAASNASWTPPASLCENAGSVNLNNYFTGGTTTGGAWSGTGVSGTTFNPSGLSGNQAMTYSVGPVGCTATSTQNINVIPDVNPAWAPPASMCDNASAVNLNTLVSGTAGGTWSGTGVSGTNFNPSGLSGNQSVTYTVGTAPCQETSTQNINVVPNVTATWTPPGAVCASSGLLNLSTLLTGTPGGTWTGTGVSGTNFDPLGQSGPVAITYTVGSAPCTATSTQNITVNAVASAAWTSPGTMCVNGGAVNLTPFITGTAGGTWSGTGVTGDTFDPTGLAGTSPSITYTVGAGSCQDVLSQNISVTTIADASWTPPAAMCTGSSILDLSTTVVGTTGGTWSGTGVTTPNFDPAGLSGPQAVTYTVGAGACAATSTQNITVNPSTTATWTNPGPICVSATPINLDPTITGTTGGTWSGTGVTGNTFDPSTLGGTSANVTYTVGSGACQTTSTLSIVVDAAPNATWTAPAAMCSGSAILDLNTTITGTAGGAWSGTGVTTPNFDPAGLLGPQAVTYTVTAGTCTATSTQNISVNATTTPTWTSPSPVCVAGGPLNLDPLVTGTAGGTWSGIGVAGNVFDPTGLGGTTPTVTYTVGVGTCQSILSQVITIDAVASAAWTAPAATCNNSSILDLNTTLTGTAGGTWSGTGVTGSNFDPTGLSGVQAITYTVGTGSCAATSTQNINVLPVATATWTNFGPVCESSGVVNLNNFVTGTTGGTWSGTGVTGNIFDPTGLGGQAITITYSAGTSPCNDVVPQVVSVTSAPSSAWTNPITLCQGIAPVLLDTYVTGLAGGSWTIDGVAGNVFDPSVLPIGSHTVAYTSGTAPCQSTTTQTILIGPQVSAAWTAPTGFCAVAGAINLNSLITGTTGGTWTSSIPAALTGNIFNPTVITGNVTVTYTVGSGSCQDVQANIIAILPDVDPAWNATSVPTYCANDSLLDLNSLITGTLGGTWSGTGVTGSNFNPAGLSGPISITYTVGTAPCDESSVQSINVIPAPVINVFGANVVGTTCFLANGSITGITATVLPLTYSWENANGDVVGTATDLMSIPNGVYTLSVTNSSSCTSSAGPFTVGNTTLINAGFTADTIIGNAPLQVHFTDTSDFGYIYSWDFGNNTNSTAENPTGTYYVPGEYTVLLTVHDSLGCVDTASIKVVVTENFTYSVPNVFSPNGDASNDVFFVKGTGIKDVNCKIYNRWGQFMFEWTGPKGGWDGNTLSGSTAPDGVYYYLLTITDKDGKVLDPVQDYITLVR